MIYDYNCSNELIHLITSCICDIDKGVGGNAFSKVGGLISNFMSTLMTPREATGDRQLATAPSSILSSLLMPPSWLCLLHHVWHFLLNFGDEMPRQDHHAHVSILQRRNIQGLSIWLFTRILAIFLCVCQNDVTLLYV
jgi:hypothetical protein